MKRRDAIKNSALFLGWTASAGALSQIFFSCQGEPKVGWEPVFFDSNQASLVAEIAETILPKTSTPGAKEIGVPQFIDKSVKTVMSPEEQQEWVAGLKKLDEDCRQQHGKSFIECGQPEREAFLLAQDQEAGAFPGNVWGISLVANPQPVGFFRKMKGLVLFGYFTSQQIFTEVLRYDPVPGSFDGCIALDGKNSWSE